MRRTYIIGQYTVILGCLILGLSTSFRGETRPVTAPEVTREVIIHGEKIENIEKRLDALVNEYREARVGERIGVLESSLNEVKWMLRSLLAAVAGEVIRKILRMISARNPEPPRIVPPV